MNRRSRNIKTKWYKKKKLWIGIIIAIFLIAGINSLNSTSNDSSSNNKVEQKSTTKKVASPAKREEKTKPEDNVPTEYKSALKKAETYAEMMHMSKKGIFEQLTSEYGEKFSKEAAQYAIDNIKADWNKNALEKAKTYQKDMSMSPEGIRDQLTSEYGEQFTAEEANYAVSNLK